MRYSIVDSQKIEATPGAKGLCPACQAETVAKCGDKNIWHWAHKGRRHCDHWWENETAWHRAWKDRFPKEWQEIPARADDGELHVADIKRDDGLVLEFQNSPIKQAEIIQRSHFHRNIIWIINGTRRKNDKPQHNELLTNHRPQNFDGIDVYTVNASETLLLREWASTVPYVGFDFGDDTLSLITTRYKNLRYFFNIKKDDFAAIINKKSPLPVVVLEPQSPHRHPRRR